MGAGPSTTADTVASLLSAVDDPAPALVSPDGRRTMTQAELADATADVAGRFRLAGIERGDRVVVVMPTAPSSSRSRLP